MRISNFEKNSLSEIQVTMVASKSTNTNRQHLFFHGDEFLGKSTSFGVYADTINVI